MKAVVCREFGSFRDLAIEDRRTGILCNAAYEVVAHERLARKAGVSAKKVAALPDGAASPVFNDIERDILRYTDEAVRGDRVSDGVFEAVSLANRTSCPPRYPTQRLSC